jgi:hypothetical protein
MQINTPASTNTNTNKFDDYVSEITLECLMNKDQYARYMEQKKPCNKISKKDKKFYKRRIFDLTKQLINGEDINGEEPSIIMPHVKVAFDNYLITCINFFKVLDKTDIIQEDYTDLEIEVDTKNEINIDNIGSTEEANQLMMRSIHFHTPTLLDNFVTIKNPKEQPKMIIPHQKEINLKDPLLKNKGIRKKKNIINNYDEDAKNENTKIENTKIENATIKDENTKIKNN